MPLAKQPSRARSAIALVIAALLVMPTLATAQERSGEVLQQLQNKPLTPRPSAESPRIDTGKMPADASHDGRTVFVAKIALEGATLLDADTLRALLSRYEQRTLSLAEINLLADEVTQVYRNAGYLLVRAIVPQQEITDGRLLVKVIETTLGKISVSGNTSYGSDFISRHFNNVKASPSPRTADLEKALLLLNEYPSLYTRARFKAGSEPGTTDLTVMVEDRRPLSGRLTYDNYGSDVTSRHRLSAEVEAGNLVMDGDLLSLEAITGLDRYDPDRLLYLRAGYGLPVGYEGTKLRLSYTSSLYEAGEDFAPLGIHGKAHVAGIELVRPLVRTPEQSLDLLLGFDYKNVSEHLLDELQSEDDIRVFHLGIAFDSVDPFAGRNALAFNYYQGAGDFLGGSGHDDVGTSRSGARGSFGKFTAEAVRVQSLPGDTLLTLRGSAQYSDAPLYVAEQIILGGANSVRGYNSAEESGDSGYALTAELSLAPPFSDTTFSGRKLADLFSLVLFADHGAVYRNSVLAGEKRHEQLTSVGAGLRFELDQRLSLKFDFAVPERDNAFKIANGKSTLQLTLRF